MSIVNQLQEYYQEREEELPYYTFRADNNDEQYFHCTVELSDGSTHKYSAHGKKRAKKGAATKALSQIYQDEGNSEYSTLEDVIIDYLHQHGKVTAKVIARSINKPKKSVNSMLYRLAKKGKVSMIESTPPIWMVTENSPRPFIDQFPSESDNVISISSSKEDALQQQIDQLREDLDKVNTRIEKLT